MQPRHLFEPRKNFGDDPLCFAVFKVGVRSPVRFHDGADNGAVLLYLAQIRFLFCGKGNLSVGIRRIVFVPEIVPPVEQIDVHLADRTVDSGKQLRIVLSHHNIKVRRSKLIQNPLVVNGAKIAGEDCVDFAVVLKGSRQFICGIIIDRRIGKALFCGKVHQFFVSAVVFQQTDPHTVIGCIIAGGISCISASDGQNGRTRADGLIR